MSIKKIIKRTLLWLLSIGIIICLAIAFAINFVFTPEKITPLVTDLLNENLEAKIECESIELTFFSSFPHFGIELKKGMVLVEGAKGAEADTLARFENCRASFNARRLYLKHDLIVNSITLTKPQLYAKVHKSGKANWEIVKETPKDTATIQKDSAFTINNISIKKLLIEDATLDYHDYLTKTHVHADSLMVDLKVADTDDLLELDTETAARQISFSKDGYRFAKKLKLEFGTKIVYNKKEHRVDFDKSTIRLNDIDFITEGHFKHDRLKKSIDTDVTLEMKVPSLKTLWETIPAHLIQKDGIEVQGDVVLKLTSKGIISKGRLPLTDIVFKINNGELRYKKFPGEIRHLEADLHSVLDYERPELSELVINHLVLQGTGVDLKGKASVKNLLKDPVIDTDIKGDLDFTTLKKKFPVAQDIIAQGNVHLDINAFFKSSEIMENNFNNIKLKGNTVLSNLYLNDPKDTIFLKTARTEIAFGRVANTDQRKAFGVIAVSNLELQYKKQHDLTLSGLNIKLKAKKRKDSVAGLNADISFNNLNYKGSVDNIRGVIRKADITAELSPKSTKEKPSILTTFSIDSAGVWQDKKFVGIRNGNYKLTIRKNREDIWMPRGSVEFNNLYAFMPEFALPLRMKHSKISINNRAITLNNAQVFFGGSDVTLTGQINNILAKKSPNKRIEATLALSSNFIDANEIMKVLATDKVADNKNPVVVNSSEESKFPTEKATDDKKTVFKIPENVNITFNSNIKKLHYGTLDLEDIHGMVEVKNGHLKLNTFRLRTLGAELSASMHYTTENTNRAKADFDMSLTDVEMENISKIMPAMDSLFPMAKSFEGKAKMRMKGTAKLDKEMNVIIPSVKAIVALETHNIMVLDSQTYKELAKTFMFRDKELNTISRLDMEMIIDNSKMEVLPALLEIDRYQLAVGGIQNLDMTYNYHVSVLKSPMPFKTGVDIKGDFNDFKISLTKAKYKFYFTDKQRLKDKADESIVKKKKYITSLLDLGTS